MAYTKTTWVDGQAPSINAINLNKIEQGIADAYVKQSSGIPYADLASGVKSSLNKADSAVQPEEGKGLFSGAYSDLTGKPDLATVATSGAYSDLSGKPTIPTVPTNVSAFTNDAGYLTSQSISGKENTANKVTSISSSSTNTQYPSAKAVYDSLASKPDNFVVNFTYSYSTSSWTADKTWDEVYQAVAAKKRVIGFDTTHFLVLPNVSYFDNGTAEGMMFVGVDDTDYYGLESHSRASYFALTDNGVEHYTKNLIFDPTPYRTSAAQDIIDAGKQNTLVSGTNIKTINNTSILGSGNIDVGANVIIISSGLPYTLSDDEYALSQKKDTIIRSVSGTNFIYYRYAYETSSYIYYSSYALGKSYGTGFVKVGFASIKINKTSKVVNSESCFNSTNIITDTYSATDSSNGMSGVAVASAVSGKMDSSNPSGTGSFSLNRKASTTIGTNSVAEGNNTEASGSYSHAEGNSTIASSDCSHAEGYFTQATGQYSHAEGESNASGKSSHAEGHNCLASGKWSHAEGYAAYANGDGSHAEGYDTIATQGYQHVQGYKNVEDTEGLYVDIVGWGDMSRKNIEVTTRTGDKRLKGTVYVGCEDDSTGGYVVATQAYVDEIVGNIETLLAALR